VDPRIFGPKRLLCHLGVALVFLTCLRLGWWQWDRSQLPGGAPAAQNLAYALLWPVFGAYGVYVWVRLLRMEIRGEDTQRGGDGPVLGRPDRDNRPGTALVPYVPPDPQLLAYNAYLHELNEAATAKQTAKQQARHGR